MKGDFVMKFVKVDSVPMRKTTHRLKDYFDEFMNSNVKVARVELSNDEYSNVNSARSTMRASAKRFGLPIDICKRKDEIYLIRRDI